MKKIKNFKTLNKIFLFSKMLKVQNINKNHFHQEQICKKTVKCSLNKARDLFFKTMN